MPKQLPPRPSLQQLRKQAKSLLKGFQAADPDAFLRMRENDARWRNLSDAQLAASPFTLADAQMVIAREHEFASWSKLQSHIKALEAAGTTAEVVASLRDAAGQGNLARLAALLNEHPELINERGGEGVRTALHQAVFGNSEAAVRLLLERGANPNIRCEGDNAYPLHFAVEKNRVPIIHLLVERGADTVGEGDYHELGVIGWATAWPYVQPDPETVAYLLAHGARHNIYSAVSMGDAEAVRDLIARQPADLERRMNGERMRPMPCISPSTNGSLKWCVCCSSWVRISNASMKRDLPHSIMPRSAEHPTWPPCCSMPARSCVFPRLRRSAAMPM